jgi:hypothetical protein
MPTTITSAGVTFTDTTSLTSATLVANSVGATQIANGSVTAAKLGTTEQKQICKAWVNFDGTLATPITPRAQYNVSSVTKNGTGDYTVNFATPMADANYSVTANAAGSSSSAGINSSITLFETSAGVTVAPTSSSFRFYIRAGNPPVISDSEYLCAIVFGN